MSNEKFKVKFGLAVGDTAATVDGTTGDIYTIGDAEINSNLQVNGSTTLGNTSGDVVYINGTATVFNGLTIGSSSGDTVTVNSQVTDNIAFTDNSTTTIRGISGTVGANDFWKFGGGATGSDAGYAVIATGDNGTEPIYVQQYNGASVANQVTLLDASGNTVLSGTLDVQGGTITESTGALSITTGASNGAITLDPNGTGNVVCTFANGGNLTNDRNYVFGAIRNSTTASIGDIWATNSTGPVQPFRGVSIDNSADTTKNAGYLARNYNNTSTNRSRFIFERARFTGTVATPAAVQSGDFLGEVCATGYTSTGWLNDNIASVTPAFFGFTAAENWVSNTAIGTAFGLSLAPSSTTITSSANLISVLALTPQASTYRADTHAFTAGKLGTYGMMDLNGNRANFTLPIKFPAFLATAVNNTLATTAASSTSGTATITFGALASAPFTVGSQVIVAGITPAGFNGTQTVTACTTTSVSYTNSTAGPQTVAGTVRVAGSVGWQIAVSDSPVNGGKMAYWDTTNSRFSYIDSNLAV